MNEGLSNISEEDISYNNDSDTPSAEIIEEAHKFNEIQKRGEVATSFLSKHLTKEQTPEILQEQLEMALEKVQDISAFGTIMHGADKLEMSDFQDIMKNGLKSRNMLKRTGNNKSGFVSGTLFPNHISFSMNTENGAAFFNYTFILDPKVIGDILSSEDDTLMELIRARHDRDKAHDIRDYIKFVGRDFGYTEHLDFYDYDPTKPVENTASVNSVLEYAKQAGWIKAAHSGLEKKLDYIKARVKSEDRSEAIQEASRLEYDETVFANTYFRPVDNHWQRGNINGTPFSNEVVISDDAFRYGTIRNPLCGIIISEEDQEEVLGWLNVVSVEEIKNAVPIYDKKGNLLWPNKMSHQEIIAQNETKKVKPEQKELFNYLVKEIAPLVFEHQIKPTYLLNVRNYSRFTFDREQQKTVEVDTETLTKEMEEAEAETRDAKWIQDHNTYKFKLNEIHFDDLPREWREESDLTAELALQMVFEGINSGQLLDEAFVERAARKLQHLLIGERHTTYNIGQNDIYGIPFCQLDDSLKEMRIKVIKSAVEKVQSSGNIKDEEINY